MKRYSQLCFLLGFLICVILSIIDRFIKTIPNFIYIVGMVMGSGIVLIGILLLKRSE